MRKISNFLLLFYAVAFSAQSYDTALIPKELLKGAHAVIRESNEHYVLKSVNDMQITSVRAVTVLNSSGDSFSNVFIPYNPNTKVSGIKVELFDGEGKLMKTYSKKDFSDYTNNPSAALYVDDRVLVLRPLLTKYPYTVKTSFETNTSNTVYLSGFKPLNAFDIAVERAVMTIQNNSGIKIRKKVSEKPMAVLNQSEEGNMWKYSFENVQALTEEPFSPDLDYLVPQVEFSPEKFTLEGRQGDMTDWDSFGKWYYSQLLTPVSAVTPEIAAEVKALNLSGSTAEKVKTVYQYMQNKTRYVLIAMGIGGWQPMPAAEVSKKGYGDCKALTNYMRTLLSAAGIPSYFSVIYDGDSEQTFDKDFPRLSGNHAVLMVPTEEGNLWLENTSQRHAFNHLSFTSHHRNVLAVNENGIQIVNTPVYTPRQSKEKLTAQVAVNAEGGMTSVADFKFSGGQYDMNLRLFNLKSDEVKEAMKNRYQQLKIEQIAVNDLQNNRDEATISYALNLQANSFAKKLGTDLFFPVMPFYPTVTFTANEERQHPFEISFPFQDDYEIEYAAPEGYAFKEVPASVITTTEFGNYHITFQLNDKKLKVHRVLTINKGLYPKEKYKDYVSFRKKTASSDNIKVLISKI
ncbi:DUF3857 domain-containing protein [Kaistella pullorum]|uniref:DUF3857 domain-containing protein n=1 Tax=Kaistella pullorum TaxID=2763074 RepID=A0ABR8WJ88_9FLAO|nr:DUF3857 domain-containing protein [Kaistella pullorum]MBD8017094.1 DUF3857 domain-containing protein [Kaistella pullorum]